MTWCDQLGSPGEWQKIDDYLHALGIATGPPCYEQTTSGADHGHAANGNHPKKLARDISYGNGGDELAAVRALRPFYPAVLSELYHAATNTWLPTNVGGHTDHLHAAIRSGAQLPSPQDTDEGDSMGVDSGSCIRPGESVPYRIVPPGDGASGGGYEDPVYISIPFDTLGGTPGKVRWAIVDDTGHVIASNDGDNPKWSMPMCGVRLVAHRGAYQLTVENKEPTGGRIVGAPCFEWARPRKAGASVAGAEAPDLGGQSVADIEGEPAMAKADLDTPGP